MKPLSALSDAAARKVVCVLTDIDDTLTTEGRLPAAAYAALEHLHAAGLKVVPITGRPAGWCDMVARFWPVDGVVGENGAFYFRYDPATRKMIRRFVASDAERTVNRARLTALGKRILAEVPGSAISADQLYREADLAIDFCEDVPKLSDAAVTRIVKLFEAEGAVLGLDLDTAREKFIFCGDSPNDAPMFGYFPLACGVANVRDFACRLPAEPAFVSDARGGAGFVEIANRLLAARRATT